MLPPQRLEARSGVWQRLLLLTLLRDGSARQVLMELSTMPASCATWLSKPAGGFLDTPRCNPRQCVFDQIFDQVVTV